MTAYILLCLYNAEHITTPWWGMSLTYVNWKGCPAYLFKECFVDTPLEDEIHEVQACDDCGVVENLANCIFCHCYQYGSCKKTVVSKLGCTIFSLISLLQFPPLCLPWSTIYQVLVRRCPYLRVTQYFSFLSTSSFGNRSGIIADTWVNRSRSWLKVTKINLDQGASNRGSLGPTAICNLGSTPLIQ